jgi:hypothetical protein
MLILTLLLSGCSLLPTAHIQRKVGAPIGTYPNATALTGPEQMIGNQNGVTVTITPTQIARFGSAVAPLANYTVAGLPTCNSSNQYTWAVVTDDVLSTQAWNNTPTGGSTGVLPVFCNGSAWLAR